MGDVAHLGEGRFRTVDRVIDRKKMCDGELANPVDVEGSPTLRLDGGPRPRAVVSPNRCGREVPMRLLLKLEHFDFNGLPNLTGGPNDWRDGEGIDVAGKLDTAAYRNR
jgi:hypothetical protein